MHHKSHHLSPSAAALQKSSTDPLVCIKQDIITNCPVLHPMHMAVSQHARWSMPWLTGRYLQARLCEQEAATAEQSACAQQLQEAVETGKGKLAESAAFMQKLQDEQSRAREQIAEYAAQVLNKHRVLAHNLSVYAHMSAGFQIFSFVLMLRQTCSKICQSNDT